MGSSLELCEPQIIYLQKGCKSPPTRKWRWRERRISTWPGRIWCSSQRSFLLSGLYLPAHLRGVPCKQKEGRHPGAWAEISSLRLGKEGAEDTFCFLVEDFASLRFSTGSREHRGHHHFQDKSFPGLWGSEGLTRRKADRLQSSTSRCLQAGLSAQESLAGGRAECGAISQRRVSAAVPGMRWCPEEPLAVMMMGI